ncbi:MAG: tripartite tricarboxylate transporter substrate binding protein [Burkholderiaceae bacterium]|nr:tripartite tricarboxylate transporter substrate binding protein [Burkholderiaceae bacterium]
MLHNLIHSARRVRTVALTLLCCLAPGLAAAQSTFPSKAIRIVVPFAPGGVADTSARLIAEQLTKRLNQQVYVENKSGASGNIGTALVANAEPDGYTLLLGFDGTIAINPHIFDKIPFDSIKDFAPVGKIGDAALILVANPELPAKTLQEVLALSKKREGGLGYGTSGVGGTPHIGGELINQATGSKLMHIPYKGGGQALIDVQGGAIPLVFTAVAGAYPFIKSGRVIAIGTPSAKRVDSLPDVPTFIESGLADFVLYSWVGLLAPAKTPKPVIDQLNQALNAALTDPDVVVRLDKLGITATPGAPAQFGDQIKRDLDRYGPVVKAARIKVNE